LKLGKDIVKIIEDRVAGRRALDRVGVLGDWTLVSAGYFSV